MTEKSSSITVSVTFKCGKCKGAAEMVEVDDALDRVSCLSCGVSVYGDRARLMYTTLLERYRFQKGRDISNRHLRKRGVGHIPLRKVGDEFSDPRWPFILKVDVDS